MEEKDKTIKDFEDKRDYFYGYICGMTSTKPHDITLTKLKEEYERIYYKNNKTDNND